MDFTLEGLLLGLLAIGIGLAFAFYGFRVFLILLPIWGFFAGFLVGANGMEYLFGDAFLATATGWIVRCASSRRDPWWCTRSPGA